MRESIKNTVEPNDIISVNAKDQLFVGEGDRCESVEVIEVHNEPTESYNYGKRLDILGNDIGDEFYPMFLVKINTPSQSERMETFTHKFFGEIIKKSPDYFPLDSRRS